MLVQEEQTSKRESRHAEQKGREEAPFRSAAGGSTRFSAQQGRDRAFLRLVYRKIPICLNESSRLDDLQEREEARVASRRSRPGALFSALTFSNALSYAYLVR